jgi:hypothetical protein
MYRAGDQRDAGGLGGMQVVLFSIEKIEADRRLDAVDPANLILQAQDNILRMIEPVSGLIEPPRGAVEDEACRADADEGA